MDGPGAVKSVLYLCRKGIYPNLAPLGQPTSTTTQPPLNNNERQQNKTHSTNGKGMARHRPKAAKKEASQSVTQWYHPHCKAPSPSTLQLRL